jgi:4-hydroxy-tetrahydrodipicolinate synthase
MMMDFSGLAVALATPFNSHGDLDLKAFRRLVQHVATGGADTLVVLGTTGEASTLDEEERDTLITACLQEARGKKVVVGTGHNATRQAAAWTKRAQALGAHGALVVTPYYNKPTTAGLVAHYSAVADAAHGLPLILYNVPGRTGLNVTPPALAKLWANSQVVAVKESSGNLPQIMEIARTLPPGKQLLCGDDNLTLPAIAAGACGLVSVLGNLLPAQAKAWVEATRRGDLREAQQLQHQLLPLIDALFMESNPIPLKAGLRLMGLAEEVLRLPLTTPEAATRQRMTEVLSTACDDTLPGLRR